MEDVSWDDKIGRDKGKTKRQLKLDERIKE